MKAMDDLDDNPLHKAFLTKFRREFEIACTLSYIIALPHSDCLENVVIDQVLANSHILMPSKLLKLHYTPLQVGFTDDIEMDGSQLIVYLDKRKTVKKVVNILAEQIGYNINNKEFKTLIIDEPLIAIPNNKSFIVSLLSPLTPKSPINQRYRNKKLRKPIQDHDDCLRYLEFISQEITMQLENDVRCLQSHYLILSHYLKDAAERIKNLAELFIPRFEVAVGDNTICDSVRQNIRLAVENHIVHLMHGKLMVSIFNRHEIDDRILSKKFNEIYRSKLTICQLGAQSAFSDFIITDEIHQELIRLPSLQSPLAIVSSLMKLVRLISDSLDQSVKSRYLTGQGGQREDKELICSDDLIATLVYVLAYSKPMNLFSISKYLETFGWASIAKDQAAYYTATFQIVIQYIYNYSIDQSEEVTTTRRADVPSSTSKTLLNILPLELENGEPPSTAIPYKLLGKDQFIDSLDSGGSFENTDSDSTSPCAFIGSKAGDW